MRVPLVAPATPATSLAAVAAAAAASKDGGSGGGGAVQRPYEWFIGRAAVDDSSPAGALPVILSVLVRWGYL